MDEYARKYQNYFIKCAEQAFSNLLTMFRRGETALTDEELKMIKNIRNNINDIIAEDMNK